METSVNVKYWEAWFKWVTQAILAFAKKGDFLGLATFCAELGPVLQLLIVPVESLAACFHGSWFSILIRLSKWAKANPDPLAEFRHAAEAFKAKWSKAVPAGSPSSRNYPPKVGLPLGAIRATLGPV